MGSQLSLPHRINKKNQKCMIGPVQSHFLEGSPVGKRNLKVGGICLKVGFEPGVKE